MNANPAMTRESAELEGCRRALGAPPRRFGFWDRRRYLSVPTPRWAKQDPLMTFFSNQRQLLEEGRVTWGHVVQANEMLFQPGPHDCPGAVVYAADPSVALSLEELGGIAGRMFDELKDAERPDPALAEISRVLTDEMSRPFGISLPPALSPNAPCALSTVFVARKHLPNAVLSQSFFPMLVLDRQPRVAMIVPSRYWSPGFTDFWTSDDES